MSIYYSPFRLINSPFLFANNSGREKEKEEKNENESRPESRGYYTPAVVVSFHISQFIINPSWICKKVGQIFHVEE